MKLSRSLLLAFALVFAWATVGIAAPAPDCSKKVESFNFLVDYSGSMMLNHKVTKSPKINLAKDLMTRINANIPALDYQGGLYTFAPYTTVVKQGPWNREALTRGIAGLKSTLEPFARFTPMGNGLLAHQDVIKTMPAKAAVLLISDGENNRGIDPVAEARAIYAGNPNVCFHVVSLADTPEGKATLDAISALSNCSKTTDGLALLRDASALENFVNDIFCDRAGEEVIVLRGVNFAFDSYALDANAQGILNEAARLISERNIPVRLLGWTDSVGTDAYNKVLSQNRANSVKKYLIDRGVSSSLLQSQGMGKSFRYDNATEEGRYMNRRCELVAD